MSLRIFQYTEKSIVVEGEDTKKYTKELGKLGKFNNFLKPRPEHNFNGGPAWIFSKTKLTQVTEMVEKINKGDISPVEVKEYVKNGDTISSLKALITKLEARVVKLEGKKEVVELEFELEDEYNTVPSVSLLRRKRV